MTNADLHSVGGSRSLTTGWPEFKFKVYAVKFLHKDTHTLISWTLRIFSVIRIVHILIPEMRISLIRDTFCACPKAVRNRGSLHIYTRTCRSVPTYSVST